MMMLHNYQNKWKELILYIVPIGLDLMTIKDKTEIQQFKEHKILFKPLKMLEYLKLFIQVIHTLLETPHMNM